MFHLHRSQEQFSSDSNISILVVAIYDKIQRLGMEDLASLFYTDLSVQLVF